MLQDAQIYLIIFLKTWLVVEYRSFTVSPSL